MILFILFIYLFLQKNSYFLTHWLQKHFLSLLKRDDKTGKQLEFYKKRKIIPVVHNTTQYSKQGEELIPRDRYI